MGGGEDSFSLVFENSIVLIKCTLYDTVFQRQVSICRGVVFSYSFSIYCAAYHGIWCSGCILCPDSLINSQDIIEIAQPGAHVLEITVVYHYIPCK